MTRMLPHDPKWRRYSRGATGSLVEIGIGWHDLEGYMDFLTARLLGEHEQK